MKSHASSARLAHGRWLALVRLLSCAALLVSSFLLWASWTGDRVPGCGLESGCGAVLNSRWAYWLGVPVSLFACLTYAGILLATLVLTRSANPSAVQSAGTFLRFAAVTVLGAAAWFVALQVFAIGAICPYCMAAHGCGVLAGVLLLFNVPQRARPGRIDELPGPAPKGTASRFAWVGLVPVALLCAGQLLIRPRTYDVQPMASTASRVVPAGRPPEATAIGGTNMMAEPAGQRPRRVLELHGGLITVDVNDAPMIGSREARHVAVHLFDYSCHHCRQLHPLLMEALQGLSNQVGLVSLPVPLDMNCNPLIKAPLRDHTNACAYARIGLAVFRAAPEKLHLFDDWIFAPQRPPSPEAVRAEAMRLVGTNAFNTAVSDPWVERQIELGVRILEANYSRYRKSRLPQLMVGTNLVTGPPENVGQLYQFLGAQFGIKTPQGSGK